MTPVTKGGVPEIVAKRKKINLPCFRGTRTGRARKSSCESSREGLTETKSRSHRSIRGCPSRPIWSVRVPRNQELRASALLRESHRGNGGRWGGGRAMQADCEHRRAQQAALSSYVCVYFPVVGNAEKHRAVQQPGLRQATAEIGRFNPGLPGGWQEAGLEKESFGPRTAISGGHLNCCCHMLYPPSHSLSENPWSACMPWQHPGALLPCLPAVAWPRRMGCTWNPAQRLAALKPGCSIRHGS